MTIRDNRAMTFVNIVVEAGNFYKALEVAEPTEADHLDFEHGNVDDRLLRKTWTLKIIVAVVLV